MRTRLQAIRNRKGRAGAVALEYILIAALVAIALMGAFLYFRRTMDEGVREMSDVAGKGIAGSVAEAEEGLKSTDSGYKKTTP